MPDLIGQSIDRYHILEQLGQGGMAVVYKAYDTRLEREVAVKVIRRNAFSPDVLERVLKRFDREAKSLAKLTHPNIVPIIDYGDYEGNPYLVMPYLAGGTLKQLLDHPMPFQKAAALLAPIADALGYAHQKGIIHRDVKPGNILITEDGKPMLSDFGVAHLLENEETQTLTGTGVGVGTPEYMAPEQGLGREVDGRSDVYALGIVLYELVTGRKPYTADTPMAVVLKQTTEPLPRPALFMPGLPEEMERVLFKALAKHPGDRYTDMAAFAAALERMRREQPIAAAAPQNEEPMNAPPMNTYVTVDQLEAQQQASEASKPQPRARVAQPPQERQRAKNGLKFSFMLGGIVIVGVLVVGIINSWFTPQSATAPTESPVATTEEPTAVATRVSEKDGMVQVYVPAGEFQMGSPDGVGADDEHPQHTVYLDGYWIDQTEVTNAMYAECWVKGGCTYPSSQQSRTRDNYYNSTAYKEYPVIFVNWSQAAAYCAWAGRELPTEAQWEKAARGTDGRIYPWGDQFNCIRGNFDDETRLDDYVVEGGPNCDGFIDTAPVGSFEKDAAAYGMLDMAGNVWEWVADWYDAEYYEESPYENPTGPTEDTGVKVRRGGSWVGSADHLRSTYRYWYNPGFTLNDLGFRCAQSGSEAP